MQHKTTKNPANIECRNFLLTDMLSNMHILDVGCGKCELMSQLKSIGCIVSGIEIDKSLVQQYRSAGFNVTEGSAEKLPIEDSIVDGIVCSVVLPYTDERKAISEWSRVLKPGGVANGTFHGVGFALDYLIYGKNFKRRFYGFRMLLNTMFYQLSGHRLTGFMGDTLCQTPRRMRSYYKTEGLNLVSEQIVESTLGFPKYLCHRVTKPDAQ